MENNINNLIPHYYYFVIVSPFENLEESKIFTSVRKIICQILDSKNNSMFACNEDECKAIINSLLIENIYNLSIKRLTRTSFKIILNE